MVTRKIQGSPVKVTGITPSDVEFESHLEEDFLALVRFDNRVAHFERWQEEIPWRDDEGKRRTYTPDFFVRYKAVKEAALPPEVVEVKPDFDEDDPRPVAQLPRKHNPREDELKWEAAERFCKKLGFRFLVVRESQIRTPYLDNARFFLTYLERGRVDEARAAQLIDALKSGPRLSIGELIARMNSDHAKSLAYRPDLYRLLAARRLEVDLTEPLSDSCMIGLPS